MFEITEAMKRIEKMERFFTSEADFQLAMARVIQEMDEVKEVFCEYPVAYQSQIEYKKMRDGAYDKIKPDDLYKIRSRIRLDLLVHTKDEQLIPIELKHRTKKCTVPGPLGQKYDLKSQGAHDEGCYGYARDICRIHEFATETNSCTRGYAVFLSNDEKYKNSDGARINYKNYKDFWINDISEGWKEGRVGGGSRLLYIPSNVVISKWQSFKCGNDNIEYFYKIAEVKVK